MTVVRALAAISDAEVTGDVLDSTEVTFTPRALHAGHYRFDVGAIKGSAGAISLLFQALLPPLAFAPTESHLTLIGGTHVPWSPPVHYLTEVFLPALAQIGVAVHLDLERWGWYPAGGGKVKGTILPTRGLSPFAPEPGTSPTRIVGLSAVSHLPRSIAERQRRRAHERLTDVGLEAEIAVEEVTAAHGPGTLLLLAASGQAGCSALGRRGIPAERVADEAVDQLLTYRRSRAAVDDHLADQLVPLLALGREVSTFTCPTLSPHLRTVAWVVEQFLAARIDLEDGPPARVRIIPPSNPGPSSAMPCRREAP